jgi:hypothetical protein
LEPDKLRDGRQLLIPKKTRKSIINPLVWFYGALRIRKGIK